MREVVEVINNPTITVIIIAQFPRPGIQFCPQHRQNRTLPSHRQRDTSTAANLIGELEV